MGDFLCKIWRGLLSIFRQVVDAVAEALKTVGHAVVDVLSELLQAAGSAIGDIFSANPLFWVVLLGGAFYLLTGKDEAEKSIVESRLVDNISKGSIDNGHHST